MVTLYRNKTKLFSTEINKDSRYSRQLMSDDYITLKFSLPEPIKFELGDFCDCDFGRFELVEGYNPTFEATSAGYNYELRLDAEYRKWKNKLFSYRPLYGGLESTWTLTNTISTFMQVFLSNLEAHNFKFKRETEYHVEYGDDVDMEKSYAMSFSNVNLIDALTQIAEKWETEWWIEDNIIHIGKCQYGTEENAIDFRNGVNGVISSSASKSDYITRLFVFGSTTNIPSRYRKKLEFDVKTVTKNQIYDTARPLSIEMFSTVNEVVCGEASIFKEQTANLEFGKDVTLAANEKATVLPQGKFIFAENANALSFSLDAKKGAQITSVILSFSVKLTIKDAEKDTVLSSATSKEDKEVSYLSSSPVTQIINGVKTPAVSFNTNGNGIKGVVEISVTIKGKYFDKDVSEGLDKFSLSCNVSNVASDIMQKEASFDVEFISGSNKDKTDTGKYTEGAEYIVMSALSATLGDRYRITTNIIKPKVPSYYFSDEYQSEVTKSGIVERHLMLPLSWNDGHNWIDAKENMSEEEVVEGIIVFDDIYPQIRCSVNKVLAYKIEQINEETNKGTGIYDTYYLIATDDMSLKQEYLLSSESNFEVSFNNGSLVGMVFEFDLKEKGYVFENVVKEDGTLGSVTLDRQYFHIFANENYGRLLPDTILAPKTGDEFYVLNYDADYLEDMGIVDAAEQKLLEKGKEQMKKSMIDPNTYTCSQYWWDAKEKGILQLGQRVNIVEKAYFAEGNRQSRIIGIECNLDIPYDSPEYTVGEQAPYSRLGNIEEKIDELTFNGSSYANKGGNNGISVYVIRTNDNTPPTDTNVYSASRSDYNYASKQNPDTFKGLMTFLQGLKLGRNLGIDENGNATLGSLKIGNHGIDENGNAVLGKVVAELMSRFKGGAEFGEFIQGILYGTGGRVDERGNAEFESITSRSSIIAKELIVNRQQAVESDFMFTESGSVESVTVVPPATEGDNTTYDLRLKKRWDNDFTAFHEQDCIRASINTLLENGKYYDMWFRVLNVNTLTNTISVVMYPDDEVPSGKNYPPCELARLIRWGNPVDEKRQSCWYISSETGLLVWLDHVTKPIIDKTNYSVAIGKLPDALSFVFQDFPQADKRDGAFYAKWLAVQNIINVDYEGNVQQNVVDRGMWSLATAQGDKPYRATATEVHDVWRNGCKWRCISDKTTEEPKYASTGWAFLEGNPEFTCRITGADQTFDADAISTRDNNGNYPVFTTLSVRGYLYNEDVTDHILAKNVVWTRDTGNTNEDNIWAVAHANAGFSVPLTWEDLGKNAEERLSCSFKVEVAIIDETVNAQSGEKKTIKKASDETEI